MLLLRLDGQHAIGGGVHIGLQLIEHVILVHLPHAVGGHDRGEVHAVLEVEERIVLLEDGRRVRDGLGESHFLRERMERRPLDVGDRAGHLVHDLADVLRRGREHHEVGAGVNRVLLEGGGWQGELEGPIAGGQIGERDAIGHQRRGLLRHGREVEPPQIELALRIFEERS